jgi:DNA repair exonuclease SbcCD ATPase subunit
MAMIKISLTNDFSKLPGQKDNNIRRGIGPNELSFVETIWEVTAGIMTVRRVFQGGASSFTLVSRSGEVIQTVKKEGAITASIEEAIGIPIAVLEEFAFATQDTLQNVVSGTKAERASLFYSLCGLDAVDRLNKLLRDQISADSGAAGVFSEEEYAAAQGSWLSLSAELRSRKERFHQIRQTYLSDVTLNEYVSVVTAHEKLEEKRETLKSRVNKRAYILTQQEKATQKIAEIEPGIADLTYRIKQGEEFVKQQEILKISVLPSHDEVRKAQVVLLKNLPMRPVEGNYSDRELGRLNEATNQLIVRLSVAQKAIDRYSDEELSNTCVTCGAPVDNSAKQKGLKEAQEHKAELEDEIERAKANAEEYFQGLLAITQWQANVDDVTAEKKDAEQILKKVTDRYRTIEAYLETPEVAYNPSTHSKAIQRLETYKQQLSSLILSKQEAEISFAQSQGEIKSVDELIEEIKDEIGKLPNISKTLAEEAQRHIDADTSKKEEGNLAAQAVAAYRGHVASSLAKYWHLRRLRRQSAKVRAFVSLMEDARSVLHRDRLPARVIAHMLQQTVKKMNAYLVSFGFKFTVKVDVAEIAFSAVHVDGTVEAASRLSVGQKVGLAIAFWLARSAVFVGKIPFFSLDEPTAHLDEQRVLQTVDIFTRLGTELEREGRQGVVITHHKSLASAGSLVELT